MSCGLHSLTRLAHTRAIVDVATVVLSLSVSLICIDEYWLTLDLRWDDGMLAFHCMAFCTDSVPAAWWYVLVSVKTVIPGQSNGQPTASDLCSTSSLSTVAFISKMELFSICIHDIRRWTTLKERTDCYICIIVIMWPFYFMLGRFVMDFEL